MQMLPLLGGNPKLRCAHVPVRWITPPAPLKCATALTRTTKRTWDRAEKENREEEERRRH